MKENLVPVQFLFAKWFIKIRWFAISLLITANFVTNHFLNFSIQWKAIYVFSLVLIVLNIAHILWIRYIIQKHRHKIVSSIKIEILFQIITDLLVLSMILHFSGGIENPIILLYLLHMMLASFIYSRLTSYILTAFTLILVFSLILFECYSIIPHYHLNALSQIDLYKNEYFIYGSIIVFSCLSIMLVGLSHMIISRSVKSEEKYVKTNIELQNKEKVQNEYVLRLTHDIKGHLAAILSCISLIKSNSIGSLNQKQEEFIERAYRRTEFLSVFVRDLLSLTHKRVQNDAGFERFNLKEVVDKVFNHVKILAKDKSINFNYHFDHAIHQVYGNPFTIEELYSNILLNAIKYTAENGQIELFVRNRFSSVVSEISDSGIGITQEDIPHIFDEFYRGSKVKKDIKSGSGLGLSIAKQIVSSHKGRIWVDSAPGLWTKFSFEIPKNPEIAINP